MLKIANINKKFRFKKRSDFEANLEPRGIIEISKTRIEVEESEGSQFRIINKDKVVSLKCSFK